MSHISAWGYDAQGQLGTGYEGPPVLSPVDGVAFGDDVIAAAAGGNYALALHEDGTVSAVGQNENGPHGDGTTIGCLNPRETLIAGVEELRASGAHAIARLADGTAATWGSNLYGQIGNGTWNDGHEGDHHHNQLQPFYLPLKGVVRVAAGGSVSAAVLSDGTVYVWGENNHGQCGDGTTEPKLVPTQVVGLPRKCVDVAIGGASTLGAHTLFLLDDGTVWGCGAGRNGALGEVGKHPAKELAKVTTPIPILGVQGANSVYAGPDSSFALVGNTLYAWGLNQDHQLGVGQLEEILTPTAFLHGVSAVAVGSRYAVALIEGVPWAWGKNLNGECGQGTASESIPAPVPIPGLSGVGSVAAGATHCLCVLDGPMETPIVRAVARQGGFEVAWRASVTEGKWLLGIRTKGEGPHTRTQITNPLARSHVYTGLVSGQPYEVTVTNEGGPWGHRGVECTPL